MASAIGHGRRGFFSGPKISLRTRFAPELSDYKVGRGRGCFRWQDGLAEAAIAAFHSSYGVHPALVASKDQGEGPLYGRMLTTYSGNSGPRADPGRNFLDGIKTEKEVANGKRRGTPGCWVSRPAFDFDVEFASLL
nr:hypothetical protein L204_04641 [Cryptococcus depauperatus CBS 7855]